MGYTANDFYRAARVNVNEETGYGHWVAYENFRLFPIGEGDAYVWAPLVPSKCKRERVKSKYNPLGVPGLFLEFAGLAEDGSVTQETFLDWTRRYGVLGVGGRERSTHLHRHLHRGGPEERFSTFKEEAEKANEVLRLYEAATADNGSDLPRIRALLELDDTAGSPEELKGWALSKAAFVVQEKLVGECFPRLYRRGDLSFGHSPSGFGSLLGAMYLQMMWLMTATKNVTRCNGPGCDKIINFDLSELPDDPQQRANAVRGRYKSREYCSDNCRVKRYQWRKRQENQAQSKGSVSQYS